MVHGAGVGGFLRVVDSRGESGSKVVDSVLLDVDESCEAFAIGLRYGGDQVGEYAAVVVQPDAVIEVCYRGNKVNFRGSVCAEISFHTWCIHSFVHTFRIWSAVHTPIIYVNTGGGTFVPFSFFFYFLFFLFFFVLRFLLPIVPDGKHRPATEAGMFSFVRGGRTCREFTSSVSFVTIGVLC